MQTESETLTIVDMFAMSTPSTEVTVDTATGMVLTASEKQDYAHADWTATK